MAFEGVGCDVRFPPASHTPGEPSPGERSEEEFVTLVGERAAVIMQRRGYQDVVLMAAPRALGQLRRAMQHAKVHVTHAEAHDRVSEGPDSLRARLRNLRLRP